MWTMRDCDVLDMTQVGLEGTESGSSDVHCGNTARQPRSVSRDRGKEEHPSVGGYQTAQAQTRLQMRTRAGRKLGFVPTEVVVRAWAPRGGDQPIGFEEELTRWW